MPRSVCIQVGVILAREKVDHPWQDYMWRVVSIIPGAPPVTEWKRIAEDEGWIHYHAATLPLELFRKETGAYLVNLQNREPVLYIVLREADEEDDKDPVSVHLVTASPFEAQDYLDSGEEIVDSVEMPSNIFSWIENFVDEHHTEEKFKKRRRDEVDLEEHKFGQEPIFELRERMKRTNGNG